jgi:hypothetical protein
MPGSVTISHTDALVMLSHVDAARLTTVLRRMSELLEKPGSDRLTESQVAALCGEKTADREEFTEWSRKLSEYLKAHL